MGTDKKICCSGRPGQKPAKGRGRLAGSLSTTEAAALLETTPQVVRNLCYKGRLPTRRQLRPIHGGYWTWAYRIPVMALLVYLADRASGRYRVKRNRRRVLSQAGRQDTGDRKSPGGTSGT